MPRDRSLYPDQYIEQEERRTYGGPSSQEDRLVAALMNVLRTSNLTVSPPAHVHPIFWSNPIDQSARATIAAAAGAYATVVSYRVPEGRYARIDGYGVNVDDAAYVYNGSLLWRFRVNGQPLGDGMSNWGEQRGSLINQRSTYILLREDDFFEFQVQRAVAAVGAHDVEMGFTGWQWRLRMNYEGTAASVTAF